MQRTFLMGTIKNLIIFMIPIILINNILILYGKRNNIYEKINWLHTFDLNIPGGGSFMLELFNQLTNQNRSAFIFNI